MMLDEDLHDPALFDRIDELCDRFEALWDADNRQRIEDHLPTVECSRNRAAYFRELLRVELYQRRLRGEAPTLEEYGARFPEHEAAVRTIFHESIPDATRSLTGGNRSATTQCAHCRQPMTIKLPPPAEEVICPACGSSFRSDADPVLGSSTAAQQRLGKFELLERIGRGAFGTVYRARDTTLDRLVAIKIPSRTAFPTSGDEELFVREARSVAQLSHAGIVTVLEVGQTEEFSYIVSEYVEGVTLAQAVSDRRWGFRESAEIIAQVAEALAHSHGRGIFHRDIKPSNIMLQECPAGPRALVMDFGLARRDEGEVTVTLDGQVLGTPKYMSPEQAHGKSHHVDGRTDIYSLGVVLYLLLTGEPPFRGNREMLLHQVLNEEPRPPRGINNRIPLDLQTICLKCLQKDPKRRYDSAAELARDIRRWLNGQPIAARPVSRAERLWRWCRRNPLVAGLSTAIVLSLLTGTAVSIHFAVKATRHAERTSLFADRLTSALQEQTKATRRAERLYYSSRISGAQDAWNDGNVAAAWDLLKSCPRHCRGWEYDYLCRLFRGNHEILSGHTSSVWSVAVSPDGRRIASGSGDGTVVVRDIATGRLIFRLRGHRDEVFSVAFSPDGKWIGSTGKDQTVIVWDALKGDAAMTLSGHTGPVKSVHFSPDSTQLVTAGLDRAIVVWELATAEKAFVLEGQMPVVTRAVFNPDGGRIAWGGSDGTVKVWDSRGGQETTTFSGHSDAVLGLAWSPNGQWIASAGKDRSIIVWESQSGERLRTFHGHSHPFRDVAFSPDGRRVIGARGGGTIHVWDVESGQQLQSFKGHGDTVLSVACTSDGRRIVSGSVDQSVRIWDATARQATRSLDRHASAVTCLAFSSNGRWFASGSQDDTVTLWDAHTFEPVGKLTRHRDEVLSAAFSPDNCWLATAGKDGIVSVWDLNSRTEKFTLTAHGDQVLTVAFSPNGRQIVSGSRNHSVIIWDAESGRLLRRLDGHGGPVCSAAFHPNGQWVASGSADCTVRMWDVETGREFLRFEEHRGAVLTLAFSPDGNSIASGGIDQKVKLWETRTGRTVTTLEGHVDHVKSVAFSPDGRRIASGSKDTTLKVWDVETGLEMITLGGHTHMVRSVVFSPSGRQMASGSVDKTIKLWDARLAARPDGEPSGLSPDAPHGDAIQH